MKKCLKLTSLLSIALLLFFASCKKETPAPTVSFTATVTGSVVTFEAVATDFTKFEWDFGDGSYISTIHTPTHAYSEYGKDFNVTLTIIGPGGTVSVTNKVTIPPKTKKQLLAGLTSTTSKKWRLSSAAATFTVANANAGLSVVGAYPGGVLASIGLGNAYKDEFVFKGDNTMTITSKGGGIFASMAYCMGNSVPMAANYAGAGLAYTASFTAPAGATYAINEGKNLTVATPLGDVAYPNVMTLSFTNGGFLGIKDFSTECIVTKLTDTQLDAVLFYAHPSYGAKPALALLATFEVVP